MALLFVDGFDGGDTPLRWANGHITGTSSSTRFSTGLAATVQSTIFMKDFAPASQIFMGVAVRMSALDGTTRPYILLSGDGGTTNHIVIGFSVSGINVTRGSIGGALLATYPSVFTPNSWYYLEISATIADAGGTVVVKLNGATVINFTGDTKNAGTNTTIDRIQLGSNGGFIASYDDFYLCDSTGPSPYNTFLGEIRVHSLSPTAAGSSTQFTSSSGANYTTVDELPYSATDFVTSGTSGHRDMYTMADLPASTGAILAVQNTIIAKKTDSGLIYLKPAMKSGASTYYGTDVNLGASDKAITDLHTVDPSTSTGWTASGVNNLEAGFEVV